MTPAEHSEDISKYQMKSVDPYLSGFGSVVNNLANMLENLFRKRTANLQQRTIELEEEHLKDFKGVAKAANAKQIFLANMYHEICTPVNTVIGMTRILMESDLTPEDYKYAETIESSGNHLMTIVDGILNYSKIESGKLSLEKSLIDMLLRKFMIKSAVKLVTSDFLDDDMTLWYEIDSSIPVRIYNDLVRIYQVILNSLSNVLKFTKSGGHVFFQVELCHQFGASISEISENEANLIVNDREAELLPYDTPFLAFVTDCGIGIPQDKFSKVSQSFSQIDALTARDFNGTWLGLTISH